MEELSQRKNAKSRLPFYEEKARLFESYSLADKKKWYKRTYREKLFLIHRIQHLKSLKRLPIHLDFMRWFLIDILSGKMRRFWGIYQFVALPGEGKTMSMVAHVERARKSFPDLIIGANFGYKYATHRIYHWEDIITISMEARKLHRPCIIMMDEIHVTFDSSDWRSFPPELLALLSFNRKFELEFLCTSQIYERIPKKIRDIANYTIICKNVLSADRLFRCYYYAKDDYEASFSGKKAKAQFIREFIADDDFYNLYDTLEQVDQMKLSAKEEKDKREEAFNLLFGKSESEEASDSFSAQREASELHSAGKKDATTSF